MKIKESRGDRIFGFIINAVLLVCVLACLYPLYLVVINSLSDPGLVAKGEVYFIPKGFSLDAYLKLFEDGDIVRGYGNSIVYTVFGTALSMVLTIPAAYALSKKKLFGSSLVMKLVVFTMYFSGGIVPTYMVIRGLGMLNTGWAVIFSGAVSATNMIIARTFFASSIPKELEESAEIDGCSPLQTFIKVVLPLSKAMLSVILLYYAVARWNDYTTSLYYLPMAPEKYPLQMVLRERLIQVKMYGEVAGNSEMAAYYADLQNQTKYSVIVVASLPLLIAYPFVQKFFEKGVMLGSVKG